MDGVGRARVEHVFGRPSVPGSREGVKAEPDGISRRYLVLKKIVIVFSQIAKMVFVRCFVKKIAH